MEYTLNSTSNYEDNNSILQHIVDLIDANRDMFEDIYSIKSVKTGISSIVLHVRDHACYYAIRQCH